LEEVKCVGSWEPGVMSPGLLRTQTWVVIVSTAKNLEAQYVSGVDGRRRGANKRTLYNGDFDASQSSRL
jgi:hypothetical protein